MKFDQAPKPDIQNNNEIKEKIIFDENLLNIDINQYQNQMVGETPGVDAEDILNTNKGFSFFLKNLDFNNPSDVVSKLFNVDRGVTWICESLYSEIDKKEEEKEKNIPLKEYLQKSIQNLINCYCSILDTNKVGYLTELVVQDSFSRLKFACFRSGIRILNGAFDTKHNGPANLPYIVSIPNKPNSKERDIQDGWFLSKGEVFRIKGSYIDKQDVDGGWTSIDDIKEYTDINQKLVNSGNIINLMTFDNFLQDNYGIPINEISFAEKIYLYNYLLTNSYYKIERKFKPLLNKQLNKLSFIKTFLSIEHGGKEMGDKILALGEGLPEEVAQKVFSKYGEIIDTADSTQKILENILSEKVVTESQNEIREIRESLLIRAKDLLSIFYDKKEKDSGGLLKDLERYKSEILLIGDTYKKLKQSGKEVRLEDIKKIKITILSQEEKEKIGEKLWDITKANRPFIKEGTEEMKNREKNFFTTINNKDSSFYVLKYGNKDNIVAFCSFTPDENGDFYAESLNIESEIKSSKIGGEFFSSVLEKVKKLEKDIYGHVHPQNSEILNYYQRLGFKIKEIKEKGELKYYEIRIPAQETSSLAA